MFFSRGCHSDKTQALRLQSAFETIKVSSHRTRAGRSAVNVYVHLYDQFSFVADLQTNCISFEIVHNIDIHILLVSKHKIDYLYLFRCYTYLCTVPTRRNFLKYSFNINTKWLFYKQTRNAGFLRFVLYVFCAICYVVLLMIFF